jgi:hypothetical protein
MTLNSSQRLIQAIQNKPVNSQIAQLALFQFALNAAFTSILEVYQV